MSNTIYGINGPVVTLLGETGLSMMETVLVGKDRLVGEVIGIILNPDDIHIMKKSEYSGLFGDCSSYSAEYDEINDPDFAEEDEEDADDED